MLNMMKGKAVLLTNAAGNWMDNAVKNEDALLLYGGMVALAVVVMAAWFIWKRRRDNMEDY